MLLILAQKTFAVITIAFKRSVCFPIRSLAPLRQDTWLFLSYSLSAQNSIFLYMISLQYTNVKYISIIFAYECSNVPLRLISTAPSFKKPFLISKVLSFPSEFLQNSFTSSVKLILPCRQSFQFGLNCVLLRDRNRGFLGSISLDTNACTDLFIHLFIPSFREYNWVATIWILF